MSTGCGFKCAKYLLIAFNLIFWLAGGVLLAIGIWFMADSNALRILNVTAISSGDTLVRAAAIAIIVVGGLMFIVGGLGCFGACAENAVCLIVFATILFILLAGQVAAGILAGIYRQKMMNELEAVMNKTVLVTYTQLQVDATSAAWDFLQVELKCCGVNDPVDWMSSQWYNTTGQYQNQSVPYTCCLLNNTDSTKPNPIDAASCSRLAYQISDPNRAKFVNVKGCYTSLTSWISVRLAIIIGVAIGLVVIQLIGIIMACCMGHTIRNKNVYN